ncbi:hypothetical protein M427DRAFT_409117 [Gonapodya prolifera JEL478]|uniref:Transmembrane protein n=1 Tax=Gonapodya prolifera (strain JEL478) TaxID=1344416 RepID=A0A139A5Y0_GONPJ|nr:hypothetical protein M427DRAFT_409117 [Gonapodya prolifera JEL478]|eukprot:KXS12220.1 hypothetical protein M427DRAFT_409117 [Gonapodya prolifera JEL478]
MKRITTRSHTGFTDVSRAAVHGSVASGGRGERDTQAARYAGNALEMDDAHALLERKPHSGHQSFSSVEVVFPASRKAAGGTVPNNPGGEESQGQLHSAAIIASPPVNGALRNGWTNEPEHVVDVESSIGRTATTLLNGRPLAGRTNFVTQLFERRVSNRSASLDAAVLDENQTAADELSAADWDTNRRDRFAEAEGEGEREGGGETRGINDSARGRDGEHLAGGGVTSSEPKLAKDDTMPPTVRRAFLLGLFLATVQVLFAFILFSSIIVALTRSERKAETSGGSTAVVTERDMVLKLYTLAYLFVQMFEFWMYLSSVTTSNQAELLGHAFLAIINWVLSGLMTYEDFLLRADLHQIYPDLNYYGLDRLSRVVTIFSVGVNTIGGVVWIYVTWKLYFRLGWRIFVYNGASTRVKRLISVTNIFQVLLKIDVLFLVLVSLYFIFLVVVPQIFFVMATDVFFLVFYIGGTWLLYSLGNSAIAARSVATVTLFCICSCVVFLNNVLCLFSLMTSVAGVNPTPWERKVQFVMLVSGCASIVALVVTAIFGGVNAYIFAIYPGDSTKARNTLTSIEWSLI